MISLIDRGLLIEKKTRVTTGEVEESPAKILRTPSRAGWSLEFFFLRL